MQRGYSSVSVVVPCYRSGATVERAVLSALAQTVLPLELILVDDASGDDTLAVLRRLQDVHGADRIQIITLQANRGPSAARNAGWNAARGDFVAFLDADDSWHPRKLQIQLAAMQRHPNVVLSGHGHVLGELPVQVPQDPQVREVQGIDLLWRNRFVTPSAMARRTLSERFREGQRHMEDHLLWMQIAFAGGRVLYIDAPLAAIHKPIFGAAGQSAQLIAMECAELGNYRLLWRDGHISALKLALLWAWSAVLKFPRRIAIVAARRLAA